MTAKTFTGLKQGLYFDEDVCTQCRPTLIYDIINAKQQIRFILVKTNDSKDLHGSSATTKK